MRPSSLGGGRILRRTLSVRLSVVYLSVCPSVPLSLPSVTPRHLANYNDTLSARAEGRISYGHLGRTNSYIILLKPQIFFTGDSNIQAKSQILNRISHQNLESSNSKSQIKSQMPKQQKGLKQTYFNFIGY